MGPERQRACDPGSARLPYRRREAVRGEPESEREPAERHGGQVRMRDLGLRFSSLACAELLALVVLAGCKPVGPDYRRPVYTAPPAYKETGAPTVVPPPNPQGGSWTPASPSGGLLRGKCCEVYGDPQSNKLEARPCPRISSMHVHIV